MKLTEHHMREWIHTHNIDRHIGHWIHNPRFWALVALILVIALLIATALWSRTLPNSGARPFPTYPYPYAF